MDARKNYDRFSDAPVLNQNKRPIVADMSCDKNPRILAALADNATLSIDDLHTIIGGNKHRLYRNIRVLKARNNGYIRRVPEQVRSRNLREKMCLQLAPRGVEWLNANGRAVQQPRRVYNLGHAGLVSHIMTSIAVGVASDPNAQLQSWEQILAYAKFPARTREEPDNTAIPHPTKGHIRPDTHPFGIMLRDGDRKKYRFLVVEADNGTETIHPTRPREYKGNSIYAKFEAYLDFIEHKGFHAKYGLPNYFVLFVFTSRARIETAKELLESFGRDSARNILFQLAHQEDGKPGYIFTSACERAGYDSLFLNQPGRQQ